MRKEQDIFDEFARLCVSSGYPHTIAYLCYRENCVTYSEVEGLTPDAMNRDHSITRTEISTLIGLLIKDDIDWTLPETFYTTAADYIYLDSLPYGSVPWDGWKN